MTLMPTPWLFKRGPTENPRGPFHISPRNSPGEFAREHAPVAESLAPSSEVSQPRIYSWFALACTSDRVTGDATDSGWVATASSEKPSIYTVISKTSARGARACSTRALSNAALWRVWVGSVFYKQWDKLRDFSESVGKYHRERD